MLDALVLGLMPVAVIKYPVIDPEIVSFSLFGFDFALRWYSVAYIAGLLFGWWYLRRLCRYPGSPMSLAHVDDFLLWATAGVIIGGRLGSVLFYNFSYYAANPLEIFILWQGGMAFHGGLIGVVVATLLFCRRHHLDLFKVGDRIALVAPVGLFTGRLANFINGELWGRPSDVPWAMIFPADPIQVPRHPSQLYEAFGEGLLLFIILMTLYHKTRVRTEHPGTLIGVFFIGYGLARFLVEFVREPDAHIGLMDWISRGQLLSLPMIGIGVGFLWLAGKKSVKAKADSISQQKNDRRQGRHKGSRPSG